MDRHSNFRNKESPNSLRTRGMASTCEIRIIQYRTILWTTKTTTSTVMSLSAHMTQCLNSLQELVSHHLIELHPPHSIRDSLHYRILIYAVYSHMRSLLTASGQSFPEREPHWNHQFVQIIDTIHIAFGTQQLSPYHEWPTEESTRLHQWLIWNMSYK